MTPLTILAKISVLVASAGFVHAIAGRRVSAAMRHEWWMLTIAGLLLLPIFMVALPDWTVMRLAPPPAVASKPIEELASSARDVASPIGTMPPTSSATENGIVRMIAGMTWPAAASALYGIGLLVLLMRLGRQLRLVSGLARHATPASADWNLLLADCARQLRVRRSVRLVRSTVQTMPMAFGLTRATIVIPAIGDSWPADRRRAVMLHELAHVERRDCFTKMLASVACVVYWPHPGVWWMAHRLRVERELACDDLVLSVGTSPRDYANHLLDIAYALRATLAPALSVSMASRRQLENRMLALLDVSRNRATPNLRSRLAVALLMIALLMPVAAAAISASAPLDDESEASDAAEAPGIGLQTFARSANAQEPGTWEIRPVGEAGVVHLRLSDGDGFHGHNIDVDRLSGLAPSLLTGPGGATGFSVRHDAGTFTFEGIFRNGVGAGTFTFTPSAAFADTMVARGYERPSARQLEALARQDVGTAFLDELISQGYRGSTLAQLIRATKHGVDTGFLREMGQLGYRMGRIDDLIDMRDHGVSPQYVRGIAAEGLGGLSGRDLIRARDHGISPEYLRDLGRLGLRLKAIDALINARDHGVSAEYVRDMRSQGYTLTVEELIRARDHGVSAEYVRDMRREGYTLSVDHLIWARDHGVSVEFVRDIRRFGYQALPIDAFIRLRDHGVNPAYISELAGIGYPRLEIEELVSLRDRGVSPDEVRRANARAGTRLPVTRLLQLADAGWRQSRLELRFMSKLSSLL